MKTLERLGTEPVGRLLKEFSVPAVVSTVANALYTVVNRLYIGQGCGRDAIAGVALAFPFLVILIAFGITQGMQPIIGYNTGAKNFQRVRDAYALCLKVATTLCLLLSAAAVLFAWPIVRGFTGDPELLAAGPVSDAAAAALTCFVAAAELRRLKRLAAPSNT